VDTLSSQSAMLRFFFGVSKNSQPTFWGCVLVTCEWIRSPGSAKCLVPQNPRDFSATDHDGVSTRILNGAVEFGA
jgi:hypothetical protein